MTGAECSLRQESGPQSRFLTRLAGPKYLGHLMLLLKHLAKKQDQQLSCKPGPAAAKQQLKLLHHSVGLMNIFYWTYFLAECDMFWCECFWFFSLDVKLLVWFLSLIVSFFVKVGYPNSVLLLLNMQVIY